jgi:hypothetical protein
MGYAWNQVCYNDTAGALDAFARDIPTADAAGINSFTAAPSISGSGLITWSISNRPLSGTAATTRTGTTQLLTCTTPTSDQWPVQSWLVPLSFFFALCMGFRSGYRA